MTDNAVTKHPTPVEIRLRIAEKLAEDARCNSSPAIPVRALTLINEAISEACNEGRNQQ